MKEVVSIKKEGRMKKNIYIYIKNLQSIQNLADSKDGTELDTKEVPATSATTI